MSLALALNLAVVPQPPIFMGKLYSPSWLDVDVSGSVLNDQRSTLATEIYGMLDFSLEVHDVPPCR